MSLILLTGLMFAQEAEPSAASPTVPPPAEARVEPVQDFEADAKAAPEQPRAVEVDPKKRKKVIAVLAAVAGIAVLGVGAIAATMVWARRLRRIARDPGPKQTTIGNDFWFLKPEKAKVDESNREVGPTPPQSPPSTESPE